MEPFKNLYNKESLTSFSKSIAGAYPQFNSKKFLLKTLKDIADLEMKDRVRAIANNLHEQLPKNYQKATDILISALAPIESYEVSKRKEKNPNGIHGFMTWPLTQYVEMYGHKEFEVSINALYEMTQRFTSEFAIRPFIELEDKKLYKVLSKWKKDKNHHVRRLVSEGTRPKLPWGIKVEAIHANLERNTKLIHSLRLDSSLYVRKSVANHLNDISYLDQNLFFDALEKMGNSPNENWIKRHATRSLLKKGHPKALKMHGYNPKIKLTTSLKLSKLKIVEGDSFEITVKLNKEKMKNEKILVDYIIHYPKKNGLYTQKVFRIKDTEITNALNISKKIHFKKVTTRTHYPGKYFIELQVNGNLYAKEEFILRL